MTLFVDSSDRKEIETLFSCGCFSGVTTNPLIIAKEAGDEVIADCIRNVLGASTGDVSVELTTENAADMLDEADRYYAWNSARIVIKVPFSEVGLQATRRLIKKGIRVNATCLMATNQAYMAALAGATYVSIFSGRIQDMGYDARPVIASTRALFDAQRLASKIIVGSIRHMMDVNEALQAGAHIVTAPPPILRKMLWNPRTVETIAEFNAAWRDRKAL